jgi:hypothetical protein
VGLLQPGFSLAAMQLGTIKASGLAHTVTDCGQTMSFPGLLVPVNYALLQDRVVELETEVGELKGQIGSLMRNMTTLVTDEVNKQLNQSGLKK